MGAAEGRQEIVKRNFVRDVYSREPQSYFRVFAAEQIVSAHTKVEQVARCNPGRIRIVILSSLRRYA